MNQTIHTYRFRLLMLLILCLPGSIAENVFAQAEVMAWGNMTGIRIDGELMAFETSLLVVGEDETTITRTAKERQRPRYNRDGDTQTIMTRLPPFSFTVVIRDTAPGSARIDLDYSVETDSTVTGAFFCIDLPGEDYFGGTVELSDTMMDLPSSTASPEDILNGSTEKAHFVSPQRWLQLSFEAPIEYMIRRRDNNTVRALFAIGTGDVHVGQSGHLSITLEAGGDIDRTPIELVLDTTRPDRRFDGLGGNFRLQNPDTDPQVIDYVFENLRMAWGRVEMPWSFWHPDEAVDPLEAARAGEIHPRVHAAMDMARRLAQLHIPVIVSDWSAPAWAIIGDPRDAYRPQPGGLRGYPLDPEKMDEICASITGYLAYLKEHYGVETAMFSFNESDLGIYVRQTGEEHAELIKTLGPYMASRGLATKMLLGDTSDARPVEFIVPALNDLEAIPYIGAVSFHSWRGCTDEILKQWGDAARKLNIPLLIGEGSTDAAAWTYPDIFSESTFALHEINLYTRICAISRPRSILQWQLTADYSVMAGGGIFGNEEPLHPTQRFWNLKQLASTPAGAFYLPLTCNHPDVNCVGFGDIANRKYAVHIVNNGAARTATLTGLPSELDELRVYVTDHTRGMEGGDAIPVVNGSAQFTLESASFTTLFNLK